MRYWSDRRVIYLCGVIYVIMAFVLMVIVEGEAVNTDMMYFQNINRCNYFADAIEKRSTNSSQYQVTAWCEPRMVPDNTKFWD